MKKLNLILIINNLIIIIGSTLIGVVTKNVVIMVLFNVLGWLTALLCLIIDYYTED